MLKAERGMDYRPRVLTATFEIVTPMFLGGAEHEASRIRGSAVKGALAFWWRALNFARFIEKARGNANSALTLMRQRERELFGAGGKDGGLGAFLLRIDDEDLSLSTKINMDEESRLPYIARGLLNHQGKLERKRPSFIEAGGRFSVQFVFRPCEKQWEYIDEILGALKLFGLIGGLGARVRRGWGSVALVDLQIDSATGKVGVSAQESANWQWPNDVGEYGNALCDLLSAVSAAAQDGSNWNVTAFDNQTIIALPKVHATSCGLDVLDFLGQKMHLYRSWYSPEKNFPEDHDWFKNGISTSPNHDMSNPSLPKRAAFGLPHNYFTQKGPIFVTKSNRKIQLNYSLEVSPGKHERRGSPLFFHVHKLSSGKVLPVVLLFKNMFLPGNEGLRVSGIASVKRNDYGILEKIDKINIKGIRYQNKKKYDADFGVIMDFVFGKKYLASKPICFGGDDG